MKNNIVKFLKIYIQKIINAIFHFLFQTNEKFLLTEFIKSSII